eukprot:jgi/Ulvmu1/8668/UM047_0006.1
MPSLVLLGKRWNVSSDDVPIPAAIVASFHFAWIVGILSLKGVVIGGGEDVCARAWPYAGYVFLILACFVTATTSECFLIREGCRGSLFEDKKRMRVPQLLIANLLVGMLTAIVNTWGTWMLFHHGAICKGTAFEWRRNAFNALVWTTWAMLAMFVICVVAPLQLVPATEHSSPRSWRFRCMVLACCCCRSRAMLTAPQGERRPLERIADLFHKIFRHADFTSSDVAVTLYLAAALQRLNRRRRVATLLQRPRDGEAPELMLTGSHLAHELRPHEPVSALAAQYCKQGRPATGDDLRLVTDIAPFAMAAYGTLFYVYVNPQPTALANFCCHAVCLCCGRGRGRSSSGGAAAIPPGSPAAAAAAVVAAERRGPFGMELDPTRVMTKAAVSAIAGVPARDVKHLSSTNSFNMQAPYFLALHRASRSVVVSVRGTFSLDDTLTDLMCHPEDYNTWVNGITASLRSSNGVADKLSEGPGLRLPRYDGGSGCCRGGAGHSGAMRLAASLVKGVLRSHRLERLLGVGAAHVADDSSRMVRTPSVDGSVHSSGCLAGPNGWTWQRSFGRSPSGASRGNGKDSQQPLMNEPSEVASTCSAASTPHGGGGGGGGPWRLVITGHSLGAGIAAFAAMYLHAALPDTDVTAWCFSPPGWLMTPQLADWCRSFVTSVVINKDIVPRLTLTAVERLRDELVEAGVRCRRSKPHVVLSSLWHGCCFSCCRRHRTWADLQRMFAPESEGATAGARGFLASYQQSLAQNMTDDELDVLKSFRVPGRILFVRSAKDKRNQLQQERNYSALWITAEDLQREGLLLSRHMLLDHFPDRALNILRRTARQLEDGGLLSGGGGAARWSSVSTDTAGMAAVGDGGTSPVALQPPHVQSAAYSRGILARPLSAGTGRVPTMAPPPPPRPRTCSTPPNASGIGEAAGSSGSCSSTAEGSGDGVVVVVLPPLGGVRPRRPSSHALDRLAPSSPPVTHQPP